MRRTVFPSRPVRPLTGAGRRNGRVPILTDNGGCRHRRGYPRRYSCRLPARSHGPAGRGDHCCAEPFHAPGAGAPPVREYGWSRRPPHGCSAGGGCGLSPAGRSAAPQVDDGGEVAGQDDGALLQCGVWRAGACTLLHAPAMVNSAGAAGAARMLSCAGRRRPVMRHPQPRYASALPASASGSARTTADLTRRRPPKVRLRVSSRAACASAAARNATIASATASGARLGR